MQLTYTIDCSLDNKGDYRTIISDAPENIIKTALRKVHAQNPMFGLSVNNLVAQLNKDGYCAKEVCNIKLNLADEMIQPMDDAIHYAVNAMFMHNQVNTSYPAVSKLITDCMEIYRDDLEYMPPVTNSDASAFNLDYVQKMLDRIAPNIASIVVPYHDPGKWTYMINLFTTTAMQKLINDDLISKESIVKSDAISIKKSGQDEFVGQIMDIFEDAMTENEGELPGTEVYISGKDFDMIANLIHSALIESDNDKSILTSDTRTLVDCSLAGLAGFLSSKERRGAISLNVFTTLQEKIINTAQNWNLS